MHPLLRKFLALALGYCFVVAGVICVSVWIEHESEERQIRALLAANVVLSRLESLDYKSPKTSRVIPRVKGSSASKGCGDTPKSNFLLSADRKVNQSLLIATRPCPCCEQLYLF